MSVYLYVRIYRFSWFKVSCVKVFKFNPKKNVIVNSLFLISNQILLYFTQGIVAGSSVFIQVAMQCIANCPFKYIGDIFMRLYGYTGKKVVTKAVTDSDPLIIR